MVYSGFQTGFLLLVVVFCCTPFSTSASLDYERLCQNRKLALLFGANCTGHIRTVVDCEVGEWNPWLTEPDGCTKSRKRGISRFARNGGVPCPNLNETTTTCNFTNSPTDDITVQGALDILQGGLGGFGSFGPGFVIPGRSNLGPPRKDPAPTRNNTNFAADEEDSAPNNTQSQHRRSTLTPIITPPPCPPDRDIVIVVDSSASVGRSDFRKALTNLGRFIPYLCGFQPKVITACRSVRLALVTYGSEARLVFDLKHSMINHTYQNRVQNDITYLPQYLETLSWATATGDALKFVADRVLQEEHGMRNFSKRTILLLTDGKSNKGRYPVEVAKTMYNQTNGLAIVALGIGDGIDYDELRNITNHYNENNPLVILLKHGQDFTTIVSKIIALLQQGQGLCDVELLDKKRK